MSDDPKAFNKPAADFLCASDVSSVGRAVLALAMELSVTNDRLIALEDFFDQSVPPGARDAIAERELSDAAKDRMAKERERIVSAVIKALSED